MNRNLLSLLTTLMLFSVQCIYAQTPPANIQDAAAYDEWKSQFLSDVPTTLSPFAGDLIAKGGGDPDSIATCDCWVEPDASYTTISNANPNEWTATGFANNDDGSYGPVDLPFSVYLYGQYYTQCYININGNISFGGANGTYNATGFPTTGNSMVAPFWADVDVGAAGANLNMVQFKVTPQAIHVNWTNVGYYNEQTDKLNTFQAIIKAGDPTVDGLPNVEFCYGTMQWTTGSASGGSNGFGGTPATVGANRGNGTDYILFGRFDHAGDDYNGPAGTPSGIGWLTGKNFRFATDITTANLAPVVTGQSACDYLAICTGETVFLSVQFLSPEPDQITTISSSATGLPDYTILSNMPGEVAEITSMFTAMTPGTYQVVFAGTDDGVPSLTTTLTVEIEVFASPSDPPVITGDLTACDGAGTVLFAGDSTFVDYEWSNGYNGPYVLVGPGTYTVSAGQGICLLSSEPVVVTSVPSPSPVIYGVLFNCGGEPATLSTTESYVGYAWSNGSTDPTISVGTGNYSVTVTNEFGCSTASASVFVNSANSPTAFFTGDPGGEVFPGTTVIYNDQSNGHGAAIVDWDWSADSLGSGSGSTFAPTFTVPGIYPITLTVTTTDGCTHTYTFNQVVIPVEIIIPNVFSPNNDGTNDALVFEGVQYYQNTSLSVFNRWGQEVFASTNYKNTWRPSKDTPDGTYFYVLRLQNGKEYTGNVTLMR